MAQMLPNSPFSHASPESALLFRLLSHLPDEHYTVWHRLHINSSRSTANSSSPPAASPQLAAPKLGSPDFWVLRKDQPDKPGGCSLFIKACALSPTQIREYRQGQLFSERDPLILLREAERELSSNVSFPIDRSLTPFTPKAIAFIKLSASDLQELAQIYQTTNIHWLDRDALNSQNISASIEAILGPELGEEIVFIRQQFCPEVIVPSSCTVANIPNSPQDTSSNSTQLATFLLDYEQEMAVKSDLDLSRESENAAQDFSLRLINGVAGSGKSLIIIYRAKLLGEIFPNKSILILTHNQPLIRDLRYKYYKVAGTHQATQWLTFYQWCRKLWPSHLEWRKPISQNSKARLIKSLWRSQFSSSSLSSNAVLDELDWCKDRAIFSLSDYLLADRSGRGFPLSEGLRRSIYGLFETYQTELNSMGLMDWGDIPRQIFRLANLEKLALPQYDVILIDEAQFFAPLWFELIKRCLKPRYGILFMVADPTQGFLKRGNSWLSLGLEVRGKVRRLKRSYRTTRRIMQYAFGFYQSRVATDVDDITLPEMDKMPEGTSPQLLLVNSSQDEITRALREVCELNSHKIPLSHILIIHPEWQAVKQMVLRLRTELGPDAAFEAKEKISRSGITLCTLNSVTGLESPIVFLLGTSRILEREADPQLTGLEREELVRDNSRRLYMAMTRASQRLFITYTKEPPPNLLPHEC